MRRRRRSDVHDEWKWWLLRRWTAAVDELLESNAAKPAREQLTLIRIFEEFRERGCP